MKTLFLFFILNFFSLNAFADCKHQFNRFNKQEEGIQAKVNTIEQEQRNQVRQVTDFLQKRHLPDFPQHPLQHFPLLN